MGKYCSYPGCSTGRDASKAKCNRLGVRQLSVFKVPKNMVQRWSRAIGECLSHTDFVCELHFPNDSIIKEDRIKMPDGTIEVIPHVRRTLIADAMPIAVHNKVITHNSDVPHIEDELVGFGDHLMETSSEESSTFSESVDGVRHNPYGFRDDTERSFPESAASNDREDDEEDLPLRFTIDDVFAHLHGTTFPESWSWITNPREDSSIVYVQTDRQTLEPRLHLILHNDLSVTAQTPDGAVTIELDRIMASIQSIMELFREAESKMVCCGSGLEQERDTKGICDARNTT